MINPIKIKMNIVTKIVDFRARIVIGFFNYKKKLTDVKEMCCVYVQGVW